MCLFRAESTRMDDSSTLVDPMAGTDNPMAGIHASVSDVPDRKSANMPASLAKQANQDGDRGHGIRVITTSKESSTDLTADDLSNLVCC